MKSYQFISLGFLLSLAWACWTNWAVYENFVNNSDSTTYRETKVMLGARNLVVSEMDWQSSKIHHLDSSENRLTYFQQKYPKATNLVLDIDTNSIYKIPISEYYYEENNYLDKTSREKRQAKMKKYKYYKGLRVSIYNSSDTMQALKVQDNRLMMIQEAKDRQGEWRPIEYWQYSSCGNSYYLVDLKPKEYLENVIYQYQGDFETELRIKFVLKQAQEQIQQIIYSPTFRGSIDYGQFNLPAEFLELEARSLNYRFFK